MQKLKPKEQHELLLAEADKEKIVQHLSNDRHQDVTRIAVMLARQCALFVHFDRLWKMRVSELDASLNTEQHIKYIYVNRAALYKELNKEVLP
jgi:hypothetical protein